MTNGRWFLLLLAAAMVISVRDLRAAPPETAKGVIERFYRLYFRALEDRRSNVSPPFSKSFRALSDRNKAVCHEKAEGDICGWGSDGDPYLEAQDYEDHLTFDKAICGMTESRPGFVKVCVNVYPSLPHSNRHEISYQLIQENGHWVVDDIDNSTRKAIQEEIDSYANRPSSAKGEKP